MKRLLLVILFGVACSPAGGALVLDMPMQDDAATSDVDDVSASDNNGVLANNNSENHSVEGPGGSLSKALNTLASDRINLTTPITIGAADEATVQFFAKRAAATYNVIHGVSGGTASSNISFEGDADRIIIFDENSEGR